jgi:hypothetical protein
MRIRSLGPVLIGTRLLPPASHPASSGGEQLSEYDFSKLAVWAHSLYRLCLPYSRSFNIAELGAFDLDTLVALLGNIPDLATYMLSLEIAIRPDIQDPSISCLILDILGDRLSVLPCSLSIPGPVMKRDCIPLTSGTTTWTGASNRVSGGGYSHFE